MNTLAGRSNVHSNRPADRRARPPRRQPMFVWALVLAAAMMSFYVHLLDEQVQRGERLRQAQRGAPPGQQHAIRDLTPSDVSLAAAR